MSPEYRISGNYWLNKAAEEEKNVLKFRGKFKESSDLDCYFFRFSYPKHAAKISAIIEEFEKSREV
jgi:hypothetical protein